MSVSAHLFGAAVEPLAAAGAGSVYLEQEAGADLLHPGLPRHRGLEHHLDTRVGHTLGHAPSSGQILDTQL